MDTLVHHAELPSVKGLLPQQLGVLLAGSLEVLAI